MRVRARARGRAAHPQGVSPRRQRRSSATPARTRRGLRRPQAARVRTPTTKGTPPDDSGRHASRPQQRRAGPAPAGEPRPGAPGHSAEHPPRAGAASAHRTSARPAPMPARLVPLAVGTTAAAVSGLADSGLVFTASPAAGCGSASHDPPRGHRRPQRLGAQLQRRLEQDDPPDGRAPAAELGPSGQIAAAGPQRPVQPLAGKPGMIVPAPGAIGYVEPARRTLPLAAKRLESGAITAGARAAGSSASTSSDHRYAHDHHHDDDRRRPAHDAADDTRPRPRRRDAHHPHPRRPPRRTATATPTATTSVRNRHRRRVDPVRAVDRAPRSGSSSRASWCSSFSRSAAPRGCRGSRAGGSAPTLRVSRWRPLPVSRAPRLDPRPQGPRARGLRGRGRRRRHSVPGEGPGRRWPASSRRSLHPSTTILKNRLPARPASPTLPTTSTFRRRARSASSA